MSDIADVTDIPRLVICVYAVTTAWIAIAGLYSAALVWHDRERRSTRLFIGFWLALGWPLAPIGVALLALDCWWRRRNPQYPVLESLESAPFDDEPETPEERAAIDEARAELRAGMPTIALEDLVSKWTEDERKDSRLRRRKG